jgi:hypothetical protein
MRVLPFFLCLLSCTIAMHTLRAVATVEQEQEDRADYVCATTPTRCGFL